MDPLPIGSLFNLVLYMNSSYYVSAVRFLYERNYPDAIFSSSGHLLSARLQHPSIPHKVQQVGCFGRSYYVTKSNFTEWLNNNIGILIKNTR